MTDHELLELAAKAAGYKKYYTHYLGRDSFVTYDESYYSEVKEREVTGEKTMGWNPLEDDGDALRLAVKLHLALLFPMNGDAYPKVGAGQVGSKECAKMESAHQDPYVATRRAIVRAAAAIGASL